MTIIALIARNPMLRTAQIADRLDLTIDLVDALLRPLLIAGTVTEQEVIAPNQRPAMAYEVSEQFKLTAEYRTIMSGGEIEAAPTVVSVAPVPAAPAPVAAPAPAAAAGPAPAPVPTPVASEPPTDAPAAATRQPSKVDRAIAFLTEHDSATTAQLREVMGLRATDRSTSYLHVPIKSGRIIRDGDVYTLGRGKTKQPAAVETRAYADGTKATGPAPLPEASPAAPSKPTRCRFAVWSDGKVEIKTTGLPSVELSRDEFDALVRFVAVERA